MSETRIVDKSHLQGMSDAKIASLIKGKLKSGYEWLFISDEGQVFWLKDMHYSADELNGIRHKLVSLETEQDKSAAAIKESLSKGYEII